MHTYTCAVLMQARSIRGVTGEHLATAQATVVQAYRRVHVLVLETVVSDVLVFHSKQPPAHKVSD